MKYTVELIDNNTIEVTLEINRREYKQTWKGTIGSGLCRITDPELWEQMGRDGYYSEELLDGVCDTLDNSMIVSDMFKICGEV